MVRLPRGVLEEIEGGFRGWHGSPHRFDKFDISKIGTGEGNQAYGHGLYLGGVRPTAEYYKKLLSPKGGGHVYEVGVNADPRSLLDLDAPLAGQSETIRAPFKDIRTSPPEHGEPFSQNAHFEIRNGTTYLVIRNAAGETVLQTKMNPYDPLMRAPETGGDFYRHLSREKGAAGELRLSGDPAASKALEDAGVPGLKFNDNLSRTGIKGGSQNAVMFNDDLMRILKRYAVAAPVVPPMPAPEGTWGEQQPAAPPAMPMQGVLMPPGTDDDAAKRWWRP